MNGRAADGTFATGNAGRPKGARNRTTQAVLALLEGEAEALSRKAVEMALAGDSVALRLCLDRLAPPRKDSPVQFPLPRMKSARDAAEADDRTEAEEREFARARRYDADDRMGESAPRRTSTSRTTGRSDSIGTAFAKSFARQLGTKSGQAIVRGVLGSIFGRR